MGGMQHGMFGAGATSRERAEGDSFDSHLLNRMLVLPRLAVLLCAIEKNGLSLQGTLAQLVQPFPTDRHGKVPAHVPFGLRFAPSQWGLGVRKLQQILRNESWERVVVLRHPIERFVSAFNSKCKGGDGDGRLHCFKYFGPRPTLRSVAETLASRGAPGLGDPHWTQQSKFCGGLGSSKFGLKHYSKVVPFPWLTHTMLELFGEPARQALRLFAGKAPQNATNSASIAIRSVASFGANMGTSSSHITHARASAVDAETAAILESVYRSDFPLWRLAEARYASLSLPQQESNFRM